MARAGTAYLPAHLINGARPATYALDSKKEIEVTNMTKIFQIQRTSYAYGSNREVPDHAWQNYGAARTLRGLARLYRSAYAETHSQPNSWSGHVRVLTNGSPVIIDVEAIEHALEIERDRGYVAVAEIVDGGTDEPKYLSARNIHAAGVANA